MELNPQSLKPIKEVKYLTAENCRRYRAILRYFYLQYEKFEYRMYQEQVSNALRQNPLFVNYSLAECEQDFQMLVEWGNLLPLQDTSRAATVEEFKNKQFRYQLSEFSVEIERLTIKLENLLVEGASLEPTLFERLKHAVLKANSLLTVDLKEVGAWWADLNADFKRLNQNYQDYIRSFYSLKAEERMKTKEFIVYKDALISYLKEFVIELQKNATVIEEILLKLTAAVQKKVIERVLEYELSIPRLGNEVTERELYENIAGRWQSLQNWFLGQASSESESARVMKITNNIVQQVTRYAAEIAENYYSAANRKEDYKKICGLFLECPNMEEAHRLSALVFGIFNTCHLQGKLSRETESFNSSIYEEKPEQIVIKPRLRTYREKTPRTAIVDKKAQKQQALAQYLESLAMEKNIIESYIENQVLEVARLPRLSICVRRTLLKWISRAGSTPDQKAQTEEGRGFTLYWPEPKKYCNLDCEDGQMKLPAYQLIFE